MATSRESNHNHSKGQHKYDVTTMEKLLSLADVSRTRLRDTNTHFLQMAQRKLANMDMTSRRLHRNRKSEPRRYPVYFCREKSLETLEVVTAYCCSAFKSYDRDPSFTFSAYYTLVMYLCQDVSSKSFIDEINNSGAIDVSSKSFIDEINKKAMVPKTVIAKLKSLPNGKFMLRAMLADKYMEHLSETLSIHRRILKSRYENLLCMVSYLLLIPFGKYDEFPMEYLLKPFAEAMGTNVSIFENSELPRPNNFSRVINKTFENEFMFRKNIFKHLISLGTLRNRLGIVMRLVVQKLRFVKMDKVFYIHKYVKPYCPSILNLPDMEAKFSALIKMDQSMEKFDDCEKPFIWFLDEYFDHFNSYDLDMYVGIALAIRKYEQPDYELPNLWTAEWFSATIKSVYKLRKEDVFEYLRRFESSENDSSE